MGAIINWLADDLPRYRGLRRPACVHCGAPRPARDWLGLLAGRCGYCGRRRGLRAALVEVFSAGAAVWLTGRYPDPQALLAGAVVAFVFLLITVIDVEHRLILRVVALPGAVVVALLGALDPSRGPVKTLAGGAVGFLLLWGMYLLGLAFSRWRSRTRGEATDEVAFGFGDVMLGGLIGLVVGWPGILIAVVFGVLLAGVASLLYLGGMLATRRYSALAAIPYGPFLILGASIVYFGGRPALETLLGSG